MDFRWLPCTYAIRRGVTELRAVCWFSQIEDYHRRKAPSASGACRAVRHGRLRRWLQECDHSHRNWHPAFRRVRHVNAATDPLVIARMLNRYLVRA